LLVLIVSYGNPCDVERCLDSLSRSTWTDFEIFVCENAGEAAFACLRTLLTAQNGLLEDVDRPAASIDRPGGRLAAVASCRFRDRGVAVRLAASVENLGYAGGTNAWLDRLRHDPGWEAILVLNPDTVISEDCLAEMMAKAREGFGMVGGSLVFEEAPDRIINYGLGWSRLTGRICAVGRNSPAASAPANKLIESIDAISGACVLVTRAFIEEVGLMAEDYFLYMEDLDWGRRRGRHKIGYAPKAVVRHRGGASIGSPTNAKIFSPLAVYLASRNSILFSQRWAGWRWPLHFAIGLLYVAKYALTGSRAIAKVALDGLIDGARGKTGRPDFAVYRPRANG
jgi:hypothetical protein